MNPFRVERLASGQINLHYEAEAIHGQVQPFSVFNAGTHHMGATILKLIDAFEGVVKERDEWKAAALEQGIDKLEGKRKSKAG